MAHVDCWYSNQSVIVTRRAYSTRILVCAAHAIFARSVEFALRNR